MPEFKPGDLAFITGNEPADPDGVENYYAVDTVVRIVHGPDSDGDYFTTNVSGTHPPDQFVHGSNLAPVEAEG